MSDERRPCGCCDASEPEPRLFNAPGLPALRYRVSTYGDFLTRMLRQLPREAIEGPANVFRHPLAPLTTRDPDDLAIALLDAWAIVGDVLTFYQERAANEGFLRTATERRSALELAGLIGYRLNPGVAASTYLSFDVDDAAGAPAVATVPKGMRVQSVPAQGALPQAFETSEAITARVEWNRINPRLHRPQELAIGGGKLLMLGLSVGLGEGASDEEVSGLHPLDSELPLPASGTIAAAEVNAIYVTGTNAGIKAGDVVLFVGKQAAAGAREVTLPKVVRSVEAQDALDRTRLEFEGPQPRPLGYAARFNRAAAVTLQATALTAATANSVAGATFSEQTIGAFGAAQGWGMTALVNYYLHAFTLAPPRAKLPAAAPGAFALRTRAGFFGHNAPTLVPQAGNAGLKDQSETIDTDPIWRSGADADCYLERSVAGITGTSWMVLELAGRLEAFRVTAANDASLAEYGLSGKATGLVLDAGSTRDPKYKVRKTTGHVQSERLVLAQLPIEAELGRGTAEELRLTLDRLVLNLRAGQHLALTGERADLTGVTASEVVTLQDIQHSGGFTTLFFESPGLTHRYVRAGVTLNANVAHATHGETVLEPLGSGVGSRANQAFALKRTPLTYTSSASANGIASSLEVRVNGLRWEEAPQLTALTPSSEAYVVRIADDGKASVVFGDGEYGARLPSGVENVTAAYRAGIGSPGMVGAGRITLMTARPLGIRGVTNPLAASGAADPEDLADARENAPLTVLAMDRVVSRRDAEDYARAFAGIGKARATDLWRDGARWVHLTVAASVAAPVADGAATTLPDHRIDLASTLGQNLAASIERFKEPSMRLRLDTYQPLYFDLGAKVAIDARHDWAAVEPALRAALVAAFSFKARGFVQPVTVAEVVRVLHAVPGVRFVDVDVLRRFDQPTPDLPASGVLAASDVQWAPAEPSPGAPAQLLIVNPLGITLAQA
jgi:predicted phage baseplate assembly protein